MEKYPLERVLLIGAPGVTIAAFLFFVAERLEFRDEDPNIYVLLYFSSAGFLICSVCLMLFMNSFIGKIKTRTLTEKAAYFFFYLSIIAVSLAGCALFYIKVASKHMELDTYFIVSYVILFLLVMANLLIKWYNR